MTDAERMLLLFNAAVTRELLGSVSSVKAAVEIDRLIAAVEAEQARPMVSRVFEGKAG
jgi:hypothetical protein